MLNNLLNLAAYFQNQHLKPKNLTRRVATWKAKWILVPCHHWATYEIERSWESLDPPMGRVNEPLLKRRGVFGFSKYLKPSLLLRGQDFFGGIDSPSKTDAPWKMLVFPFFEWGLIFLGGGGSKRWKKSTKHPRYHPNRGIRKPMFLLYGYGLCKGKPRPKTAFSNLPRSPPTFLGLDFFVLCC